MRHLSSTTRRQRVLDAALVVIAATLVARMLRTQAGPPGASNVDHLLNPRGPGGSMR
jgi:hypothetical protein